MADSPPPEGAPARVVGIGASAGGVDALQHVIAQVPAGLPSAICIVLHLPAGGRSLLAPILGRRTDAPVSVAVDGEPLRAGRIYVAPADRHLTVAGGRLQLGRGPKENGVRPAVDPMLRSLAAAYGPRAVAVVLSGALGDGSGGALAIRRSGGAVLVQDPDDATVPSMPESALRALGAADAVLPAAAIGRAIAALPDVATIGEDVTMATPDRSIAAGRHRPDGPPTGLTCPECHGPIWESEENGAHRYRCRVGHACSEDALVVEQGGAVESALWSALDERVEFLNRVADRHGDERPGVRDRCRAAARDSGERAELIRNALTASDDGPDAFLTQDGAAE